MNANEYFLQERAKYLAKLEETMMYGTIYVTDSHDTEDDYTDETGNMACDYSGFCGGPSCPNYWNCH